MPDVTPKLLAAAEAALIAAGGPRSASELVSAMAADASWVSASKTPAATVSAALYVDIKTRGAASPFVKSGPGVFGLRGRDPESATTPVGSDAKAPKGKPGSGATADGDGFRAWMFQASPALYDLVAEAQTHRDEEWHAPAYHDRLTPGDPAVFMVVGPGAGIHVTGRVVGAPFKGVDGSGKPGWRVKVEYDGLVKPALTREEILADPELSSWYPFRGLPGTIFAIPEETYGPLALRLESRIVKLGGPSDFDPTLHKARMALAEHEATVRRTLLEGVRQLHYTEFEHLVVRLLTSLGFEVVHVGKSGDGGVDVRGFEPSPLGKRPVIVQAKRYSETNHVGPGTIQALRGARFPGEHAYLVTTSAFTSGAAAAATASGFEPVELVDGDQLTELLLDHSIGVIRESEAVVWQLNSADLKSSG
jgi:HJR/Mrr/RecB family endonuclease